jgi:inner membrane protein
MWRRVPRGAGMIGAIAAMIPDLDIFIWSANDPTVGWVYHRHFTHSLLFIPLGGLIAALPFLWLKQYRNYRLTVVITAIIAYATHTLLDSLTNYGTQQLWPFANTRVAWDAMPIVDPIYTLILLIGLLFTARTRNINGVRWALAAALLYVSFGFWQHQRGLAVQRELLASRNQQATRARVLPAPGWLVMWRSLYVAKGRLYVDGLQIPWIGVAKVLPGGSTDVATFDDLPIALQANVEAREDFRIFRWFADGYLAPIAGNPNAIGDMRITASVESLTPLWGLQFDETGAMQRWAPPSQVGRDYKGLLRGLVFGDEHFKPLSELSEARKR